MDATEIGTPENPVQVLTDACVMAGTEPKSGTNLVTVIATVIGPEGDPRTMALVLIPHVAQSVGHALVREARFAG